MESPSCIVEKASLTETGLRLVQLRWWLLCGLALAVLSAPTFLDIALPLLPLLAVLALLAIFNLLAGRRVASSAFGIADMAGQLAVDLVGLGVMLYLTGGATNPLVSLMLLPVAVAALSLPARWVAGIAALAVALYSFLMLKALPLSIADVERATRLHLGGMWLTFVVSALLIAWFVTRMMAAIRQRDMELATVRENSLRDAQVLALGQLAAGAAHELGTPLATMKVLAGEVARDGRLPHDIQDDMQLLQQQLDVCKEIVGNLTRRAGIERAPEVQAAPADRLLVGLLARWRTLWPGADCQFEVRTPGEVPLIDSEPTLEQAIVNLLNNAARTAPHGLRLALSWDADWLRVAVSDCGPGFAPEVLAVGGSQPLPAHEHGNGLGLWLSSSAVARLGGRLKLANEESGGCATLELPLANRLAKPDRME